MGLFSPVKGGGGGEAVDYGYKGKGGTLHQIVDDNGYPLMIRITPASWSEQQQVQPMMRKLQHWVGMTPFTLCADRGYDSDKIRSMLKSLFDTFGHIDQRQYDVARRGQTRYTGHSKATGRWKVERSFSWLYRRYNRTTQRKERLYSTFAGFMWLAFSFFWVEKLTALTHLMVVG